MNRTTSKWALLALLSGFVFVADQVTKYLAVAHLTSTFEQAHAQTAGEKLSAFYGEKELLRRGLAERPSPVIQPGWQHLYTENKGAAWGLFAGANERWRLPFFHLVSLAAIGFILSYYRRLANDQRYVQVALALVFGGAFGNAVDRAARGYVIDFIDWYVGSYHWPTFNVADSGISVGVALLLLEMFFVKRPAERVGKQSA